MAGPLPPRRSRRAVLRPASAVLAAALAFAGDAAAQSCRETLSGMKPNEVQAELRDGRTLEIPVSDLYDAAGPVATYGDPSTVPTPTFRPLRSEIPVLWRAKLPKKADLSTLRVEYRVKPGSGPDGFAEQVDGPPGSLATVPIAVLPGPTVEGCTYRSWKLVEGGALVEFDIGAVPAAGVYRARIQVRLRDW